MKVSLRVNLLSIIEEVVDVVNKNSSLVLMEQNREQTILNEIQEPTSRMWRFKNLHLQMWI